MHRRKILAELEFGSHSPLAPTGVRNPQNCGIAESRRMTQNVNKATRAGETWHRTHRAHSTVCVDGYDVVKISAAGCSLV